MVRGTATQEETAETARLRRMLSDEAPSDFTLPSRYRWDNAQVEVIGQTVAKDCNRAELAMFLEVAARYGLDPFIREIFAAKFNGSSGAVTIFAGRDGLLKVAKQTGKFVHMVSAVVRENDEYEVEVSIDPDDPTGDTMRCQRIHHKRVGMGSKARGAIIGAWALVWREGDPQPWFAEASWEDYGEGKQRTGNNKTTLWTVAAEGSPSDQGTPEAMMRKVPESIALRMAFGLAGLYGQEELPLESQGKQPVVAEGAAPTVRYGDDELGHQIQALVMRGNELVPNSWRDTKVAMRINDQPDEVRRAFRDTVARWLWSRDREFVARVIPQEAEVVEAEPVEPEAATPTEPEEKDWTADVLETLPEELRSSKHLTRVLSAVEGEALTPQLSAAVAAMIREQEGKDPTERSDDDLPFAHVTPEEYSEERHLSAQEHVIQLRDMLDATPTGEESEALEADLAQAREELSALNEAARGLGKPELAEN